MASINYLLVTLALIVSPALATDYLVGDDQGWGLNFDYQSWVTDKQFHVGDKLSTFFFSFQICFN